MTSTIPREITSRFRDRRALLWVCQRHELKPGFKSHGPGEKPDDVRERYRREISALDRRIAAIHWEAVWSESVKGLFIEAEREQLERIPPTTEGVARRIVVLAADPDQEGQIDTRELLPIYCPLGLLDYGQAAGRYSDTSTRRLLYQCNILRKMEDFANRCLIVLGAAEQVDLQMPLEAVASWAPIGFSVLVVWPETLGDPTLPSNLSVPAYIWKGSTEGFLAVLDGFHVPHADFVARTRLRIHDRSISVTENDLFGVTDRFTLIAEDDLAAPDANRVTRSVFESFLKGTEADWSGYAAGIAFPRQYEPLPDNSISLPSLLIEKLAELETPGKESPNVTLTLPAQNGSGLTTLLRLAAYEVALRGYPAMLLRQDEISFNIDALAAFLNRLSQKVESELRLATDVPALLVFDAPHEYVYEAYDVAQALSARGRKVIVLRAEGTAVDISGMLGAEGGGRRPRVRGRALRLQELSSVIGREELSLLQRHFERVAAMYPMNVEAPRLEEWVRFQEAQTFATPSGPQHPESLFWVTLHFFLFNRNEPPEGFDGWIRRVYEDLPRGAVQEAVRRIAALSAFRLVTPLWPLLESIGKGRPVDLDLVHALGELDDKSGLISWDSRPKDLEDQALRIRHPLVARQLLRYTDASISDFPVEVIWPMIDSLKGGRKADVWLSETIAFQILRSERRGGTNVPYLDKRLKTFQRIPPQISEYSKAILHHWARALYHSAKSSPNDEESDSLLHDGIEKMKRALELPPRYGRDEHPSHLLTTLGTLYFELYKRQMMRGRELGEPEWAQAATCFEKALGLIGDNFQALAAYGQRLVERAHNMLPDVTRATEEAVKALSYLDQAEDVANEPGELGDDDRYFLTEQRNRAQLILAPDQAQLEVDLMIENKQEAGYLIKARQAIACVDLTRPTPENLAAMDQAIHFLHRALAEMEGRPSWRTLYLLYRLYSAHPTLKLSFSEKLQLLEELERTDFQWHIRLRFEHAVLCYQNESFAEGQRRFKHVRDLLRQPDQASKRLSDFWRRKDNPQLPRITSLLVRRKDSDWRGYAYIAEMNQEVLFRPRHFEVPPSEGEYRQCQVRFETWGPVAVPINFPVHDR